MQDEQGLLARNELEQMRKAFAREEERDAMLMAIMLKHGLDAASLMREFLAQADETEGSILVAVNNSSMASGGCGLSRLS